MLKHPEKITYEQLKQVITALPQNEQALPATAYATGARVSELILLTKKDFHQEPTGKYLWIYCKVLKKRGKIPERKALVRMDETWLITPILNKVNSLQNPDDVLFPFHRKTIWLKLSKGVTIENEPINPHGFRKLRATHLRLNFGFDAYQLKEFFGWKDINPSGYYVGLDSKEIEY